MSEESARKRVKLDNNNNVNNNIDDDDDDGYKTGTEMLRLLLSTKAEYFVNANRTVFVATRDDKVVDVWKGLVKHNFLSVPVLQKTEHRYYGFLDLPDIVKYVVKRFNRDGENHEQFWKEVTEEKLFGDLQVKDLVKHPLSRRNPFHPVKCGFSLMHVVELLARENQCRRVPIVTNDSSHLVNLITQSQVVRFLHQNKTALGSLCNKPIHECTSVFHNVTSCHEDDITLDVFSTMIDNGISGMAILDQEGKIKGNISLRDMKVVGYDINRFWRLFSPVRSFVSRLHEEFADSKPNVIYVTPNDTLGEAIEKLAVNGIHRTYVVDKSFKPTGIISLKDILQQVVDCV